jgi:protein gp37
MNKTKIDWCDMTWNPVTGCLHGCKYCYARKIAKRFGGGGYGKEMGMFVSKYKDDAFKPPYVLEEPQFVKTKDDWYRVAPYPFGFAPTFHKYRLNEPQEVKKPQRIFVVSMGDLFGKWVPDEWIAEVFKACEAAPWHKYLFLTKNPYRYFQLQNIRMRFPENAWFGATATGDNAEIITRCMAGLHATTFISLEPLLSNPITEYGWAHRVNWLIIGQQTNPDKPPKSEWVQSIVEQCRTTNTPVFVKSPLYERFPIQEWPDDLRKEIGK